MHSIYGITTLQAYWYYHSYPNDSRVNKTSVAALWYVFPDPFYPTSGVLFLRGEASYMSLERVRIAHRVERPRLMAGPNHKNKPYSSCSIFGSGSWTASISRSSCTRCIATSLQGLGIQSGFLVSHGASKS